MDYWFIIYQAALLCMMAMSKFKLLHSMVSVNTAEVYVV